MGFFTPDLLKLQKDGDINSLIKYLSHKKSKIRIETFRLLSEIMTDKQIISTLKVLLEDKDRKVKNEVTFKFASMADKDALNNLKEIVLKCEQDDKLKAIKLLTGYTEVEDERIANILVQALNDKKIIIQVEALKTMGEFSDRLTIMRLEEKLNDISYQVRLQAVKSLGKIGNDSSLDLLTGAFVDKHIEVRRAAHEAINSMDSEKAKAALNNAPIKMLAKRMNENATMRQNTARYIGKNRIREGLPLLINTCFDEFKNVRIESIKSIGLLREKSATGTIIKTLKDPFHDVRLEAIIALGKINDTGAINHLEKLIDDKNTYVRDEAKTVLYALKNKLSQE